MLVTWVMTNYPSGPSLGCADNIFVQSVCCVILEDKDKQALIN